MAVKLGDLLLKAKLITQEQLDAALKSQREEGGKLGEALVRIGAVNESAITETLSQQFGVPSIDLSSFEIDPNVIKIVPGEVARKYGVLPVNKTGATLTIAMGDPTNVFAMDDIKFMTGYNVEPVVASEVALRKAIEKHYGTPRSVVLKEKREAARPAPRSELRKSRRRHAVLRADRSTTWRASAWARSTWTRSPGSTKAPTSTSSSSEEGQEIDLARPREIDRVRPDHQGLQSDPDRGAEGRRLGHPRRALREGVPRPVPDRRRSSTTSWRCRCGRATP